MTSPRTSYSRRRLLVGAGSAALAGFVLRGSPAGAGGTPGDPGGDLDRADELYAAGRFLDADALYRRVLAGDPHNVHALAQHGAITLMANRLRDAKALLTRVLRLDPSHPRARTNLANALWRLDEFDELATLMPTLGSGGPSATTEQMASFGGVQPYSLSGPRQTTVPMLSTEPLPLIEVSVRGSEPVVFFIDTGGTFGINEDYARELGIPLYGWTTGQSVYGPFRAYQGHVDVMRIGDIELRHVPVHTIPTHLPTTGIQAPDGRLAHGVIGTSILSHFLSTIDYVGEALVLRRRRPQPTAMLPEGTVSTRLWFAGDHYLFAHGTINGVGPLVFFVDTGGAGTAFVAPDETYAAAGVSVPPGEGPRPVTIDELTLGPARRHDLPGRAGVFPDGLQDVLHVDFAVGGLITHLFFKAFALTLDFHRMQVHLSPGL